MQKLTAILLLVSMSLYTGGYHLFFHLSRLEIKSSIRNRIRRNDRSITMERLVVNASDKGTGEGLKWEGDDEFRYRGEMYDVISKKISGTHLQLTCISDTKETALVKTYMESMKKDYGQSPPGSSSLSMLKLIHTLFSFISSIEINIPFFLVNKRPYYFSSSLLQLPRKITVPPPRIS